VDCPVGYRGLSAPLPRTVQPEPQTVRKRQQNLQRRTANNGLSAGSTRTIRQAPADCPPGTRGPSETLPNQNLKPRRIENKDEQEHEEHAMNTHGADRPLGSRGPSARSTRTVLEARTEQKTARPRKSTLPIHHRISQMVEAVETRVWGHGKRQPRMLYPKNFAS
jgi:hypothetical protein